MNRHTHRLSRVIHEKPFCICQAASVLSIFHNDIIAYVLNLSIVLGQFSVIFNLAYFKNFGYNEIIFKFFMLKELPKIYNPKDVEDSIYKKWEESGFFNPDNLDTKKDAKNYCISMPPPNVTGVLHMGHSAMLAIEDILTRHHRMKGDRTLWLPGTDHAAIATQTKVEKILKEEGINRHELGREKFLERVKKFAQESHDTIEGQIKKMGSSCDWSREAYTLDETRTKAVRSVFKMMYDDGLIYRGDRVVNWCPRCHSTLADDEVEYKEQKTKLYWIKYGPFVLATTRPETKLGDTAVAVHPSDKRYKDMIGKKYNIPGVLGDFEITVVGDRSVDSEFGSGAIKVTPAHSMVDSEIAERHNLPARKIINEDGKMMDNCGKYAGMTTKEARKEIVKDMEKMNLIDRVDEKYDNKLSICYRCDTPIEPLPSLQWFIDVNKKIPSRDNKTIKELSVEAVKSGVFGREKINIYPERFEKNYFHWMNDLKDWCISRQILFGHQIPVWYKDKEDITSVLFLRHGQTDWNVKSIMQGRKETDINETGRKQSEEKIDIVKEFNPDIIISSPLRRTLDSAKIVANDEFKVVTDERIIERSYGEIEGLHVSEIQKKFPEAESFTREGGGTPYLIKAPGVETYRQVFDRIEDFLKDIAKKYKGKRVVVMSHTDPLDMSEAIIEGLPWKDAIGSWHDNGRIAKFLIKNEKDELVCGKDFNNSQNIYVGIDKPKGKRWVQDTDTLDTWFSSGLWTFSTLASSPEQIKIENGKLVIDSDDFRNFHPTNVLETGYDILFFWIARMIIMTTYAIEDIPFQDVYLHGLVLDEKGKKMSKSKGNTIDPLEMIEKYGTDATRLSLVIGSTPGNDTKLSEEKIAGYRNFTNKLWNISRFIIGSRELKEEKLDDKNLTLADKWILGKMKNLIEDIDKDIEEYKFSQAGEKLREFTWNDFADWYLETSKFEENKQEKDIILVMILKDLLKLWHPFIPFVTEEIWGQMNNGDLLMIEKWPDNSFYKDIEGSSDNEFEKVIDIISAIRNARAENKIEPAKKVEAIIYAGKNLDLIKSQKILIKSLKTGIENLEIKKSGKIPEQAIKIVENGAEIYLIGAIDKEKEKKRTMKEIENLEKYIKGIENKLKNKVFAERAPKAVVKTEKDNLKNSEEKLKELKNI
jgi:valyl-tRNA synthetase